MTSIVEYRVPPMPARPGRTPERRDPNAASKPLQYQSKGQPMIQQWNAADAIEWGYLANTFVHAAVRAIATDLARLPLRVGDPDTGEYDVSHPMAVHLGPPPNGPNPVTSARKLIAWSVVQYLVTGRLAWEIETAPGGSTRPLAYWPLPVRALEAIPSAGGAHYFDSFEYGPRTNPTKLGRDAVFYVWEPAPHDWRQAESKLQAARLDISVAVMQDRYDHAFLANDSTPASLLIHEAFRNIEERDAWRRQFVARHRGPDRAGTMAFAQANDADNGSVAGSIDVKLLGMSQRDSEAIKRYEAKILGILVALGVPMSRIGDASNSTFSNSGQEWTNYWEGTILPVALDLGDAMAMQLLGRYSKSGNGVPFFDTSGVAALQDGRHLADASVPDLVAGGIASKNEGRRLVGLPRRDDPSFDVLVEAPKVPAITVHPNGMPPMPPPASASAPKVEGRAPVTGPAARELRATNVWRSADAQVRTLEATFAGTMSRLFERQRRATLARLRGKRGRQLLTRSDPNLPTTVRDIFDPGFWTASTEDIATGLYDAVFAVGGARVAEQFGIAFDAKTPGVPEAIMRRANQLAGQVTDTTYRAIRDALTEAVANGEGIPAMADRVGAVFDAASGTRATTIARTEVISAYNGAQAATAQSLPADVVAGQEWIATRDDRTRDAHAEADGQVVAMTDSFDVGGESLAYPGDENGSAENVINCRCTIAFLTPDEVGNGELARPSSGVRRSVVERAVTRLALGLTTVEEATAALA